MRDVREPRKNDKHAQAVAVKRGRNGNLVSTFQVQMLLTMRPAACRYRKCSRQSKPGPRTREGAMSESAFVQDGSEDRVIGQQMRIYGPCEDDKPPSIVQLSSALVYQEPGRLSVED